MLKVGLPQLCRVLQEDTLTGLPGGGPWQDDWQAHLDFLRGGGKSV